MPYKDPDKQREAMRNIMRKRQKLKSAADAIKMSLIKELSHAIERELEPEIKRISRLPPKERRREEDKLIRELRKSLGLPPEESE